MILFIYFNNVKSQNSSLIKIYISKHNHIILGKILSAKFIIFSIDKFLYQSFSKLDLKFTILWILIPTISFSPLFVNFIWLFIIIIFHVHLSHSNAWPDLLIHTYIYIFDTILFDIHISPLLSISWIKSKKSLKWDIYY